MGITIIPRIILNLIAAHITASVVKIMSKIVVPNTGLHLQDTDASHVLKIAPNDDLSADRTLTLITGDNDRYLNAQVKGDNGLPKTEIPSGEIWTVASGEQLIRSNINVQGDLNLQGDLILL